MTFFITIQEYPMGPNARNLLDYYTRPEQRSYRKREHTAHLNKLAGRRW